MVCEQVRDTTAKVAREAGSVMEKLQEKFTFVPQGPKEEWEERLEKLWGRVGGKSLRNFEKD